MTSKLTEYYRQPEIYITLPSGGQFYPEGSLEMGATGELPVYGMTAKDDVAIKTPDALISGEAVVQVIKSCIPSIKDPWQMPASDVDFVLVAIRIASYGEEMEMEATCNKCEEEFNFGIDLTQYIDKLGQVEFSNETTTIKYGKLKVHIKPLTYNEMSLLQRSTFEEQQVLSMAQANEEIDETERREMYQQVLNNMTELNISTISSGVQGIELPDNDIIVDKNEIIDFVNNSSVKLTNKITDTLQAIRDKTIIPPLDVECPKCEHKWQSPLDFDYTSFFA